MARWIDQYRKMMLWVFAALIFTLISAYVIVELTVRWWGNG